MLTSKQRAKLRGMANSYDAILHVGKDGISDNLIAQLDDALRARELIKGSVLNNSSYTVREAATELAEKANADIVSVVGSKFVLYRENKKDKKIFLD